MALVPRLDESEMLKEFHPLQDFVVVRKWKPPEKTEAGVVVLEDRNDFQSKRGTIVKIGNFSNLRHKDAAPRINVGDEVVFSAFAGSEAPMPDGYLIMRASEILMVIEHG